MNEAEKFKLEKIKNIKSLGLDDDLRNKSIQWIEHISKYKWAYNFSYLGRPAIQFPNDIWAMQELIWDIKPDLIIETGIAHGGSLIFSASMLAMLDICEAIENQNTFDPSISKRKVLGIDIDIRDHNRKEIEKHPMYTRISMIEGSSIDKKIIKEVSKFASNYNKVMVFLDSNHTHDHVLEELVAYGELTSPGSYCVVFDTIIDDMPDKMFTDRPWDKKNNPKTAVLQYLKDNPQFEIDNDIHNKLQITVAPSGFLKKME